MKKTEELYQTLVPSLKDRFYNQQLNYDEENAEQKPMLNNTVKYIIYVLFILAAVGCFSYIAFNSYKYSKKPENIESVTLIKKEITPIRTTPIEPGGEQFENQDKLIYDNIIDNSAQSEIKEQKPLPMQEPAVIAQPEKPKEVKVEQKVIAQQDAPKAQEETKKTIPTAKPKKQAVTVKKERSISNPFDVLSADAN